MPLKEEEKAEALKRLSRIEGQVKGVRRLVEEETYCVDVLIQISAIHEALRGVSKAIMRDHLRGCVTEAVKSEESSKSDKIYQELMDIIYKYAK